MPTNHYIFTEEAMPVPRGVAVLFGVRMVLAGCGGRVEAASSPPATGAGDADDAAVWSAVLRKVRSDESHTIFLADVTEGPSVRLRESVGPRLPSELLSALDEANATPAPVRGPFSLSNRVVLWHSDERMPGGKGRLDPFERLRVTYPDARGLRTVSRPGYAADHARAIVYTTNSCGLLCADGGLMLLARDANGAWRVEAFHLLWIS